jgi:hypothetical protein
LTDRGRLAIGKVGFETGQAGRLVGCRGAGGRILHSEAAELLQRPTPGPSEKATSIDRAKSALADDDLGMACQEKSPKSIKNPPKGKQIGPKITSGPSTANKTEGPFAACATNKKNAMKINGQLAMNTPTAKGSNPI